MEDLIVLWRIIFSLVVLNWFILTEEVNDDTRIVLCYCGVPPRNSSEMPEFLKNVHHINQFLDCLVAVALEMLLEASRLSLAIISRR